jgi:hypothetical protein
MLRLPFGAQVNVSTNPRFASAAPELPLENVQCSVMLSGAQRCVPGLRDRIGSGAPATRVVSVPGSERPRGEKIATMNAKQLRERPLLLIHGGLAEDMNADRFWMARGIRRELVDLGWQVLTPDRETTRAIRPLTRACFPEPHTCLPAKRFED